MYQLVEQLDFHNAGSHNSIYRGKYFGDNVTAEQWAAIKAGTFDDLFIGDYWTMFGINFRIAGFDYWLNAGDTPCTDHHVVIVPDSSIGFSKMNSTDITTNAYVGSDFYTGANSNTGKSTAISYINDCFGASHILSHRELFTTRTEDGGASSWYWYDSTVDLMNENMVYGARIWGNKIATKSGYNTGIDKGQLPLFRLDHSRITNGNYWMLRDVSSDVDFCAVSNYGQATSYHSSYSCGVRPAFGIYQT